MRTIPPNSPDQAVPTGLPSTPLSRVTSSSSVERQAGETPPTPRPRPRSGEQQELRQRLNALETKVSETEGELEVANRKITHLESRNQLLEAELMAGSRGGKEDVEESLRLARRDSVKLQEAVRASEAALRDTQSRLNKSESRIAGLQEEVNVLKQPYDPRRRLEVRLSEAIGKSKELEEEVAFLREVRMQFNNSFSLTESLASFLSILRDRNFVVVCVCVLGEGGAREGGEGGEGDGGGGEE